jgi:hypothetical protein
MIRNAPEKTFLNFIIKSLESDEDSCVESRYIGSCFTPTLIPGIFHCYCDMI